MTYNGVIALSVICRHRISAPVGYIPYEKKYIKMIEFLVFILTLLRFVSTKACSFLTVL